jgi:hypothetical protein
MVENEVTIGGCYEGVQILNHIDLKIHIVEHNKKDFYGVCSLNFRTPDAA